MVPSSPARPALETMCDKFSLSHVDLDGKLSAPRVGHQLTHAASWMLRQKMTLPDESSRIRVQGLSIALGSEWQIAEGWADESIREQHGVYLAHKATGLALHVRSEIPLGDGQPALDERWPIQNWASGPLDILRGMLGSLSVFGARFRYEDSEPCEFVREWWLSDGERVANASILHPEGTARSVIEDCERILATVEFRFDRELR
jgi:hypothetical protein